MCRRWPVWAGLFCWCLIFAHGGCSEPLNRSEDAEARGGSGTDRVDNSGEGGAAGADAEPRKLWLGRSCEDDAACGGELRCLNSTEDIPDGQGAPAGGLCTTSCETDADCRAFDPTAVCATLSEVPLDREVFSEPVPRLCLPGCSLGSPAGSAKCYGRPELACRPFAPSDVQACGEDRSCENGLFCFRDRCRELACGPRCNADADCSEGRFCNPRTGLCHTARSRSVPVGQSCDPDVAGGVQCGDGTCLVLFDPNGVRKGGLCTQSCTLGRLCGADAGACVMPRFDDYASGDIAYCIERCNCDGECKNPAHACLSWDSDALSSHYESSGYCAPYESGAKVLKCGQP